MDLDAESLSSLLFLVRGTESHTCIVCVFSVTKISSNKNTVAFVSCKDENKYSRQ